MNALNTTAFRCEKVNCTLCELHLVISHFLVTVAKHLTGHPKGGRHALTPYRRFTPAGSRAPWWWEPVGVERRRRLSQWEMGAEYGSTNGRWAQNMAQPMGDERRRQLSQWEMGAEDGSANGRWAQKTVAGARPHF